MPDAGPGAALQEVAGLGRVVVIVLQGIGDRLRHHDVCREVHDGLDFMVAQESRDEIDVAGIPDDEIAAEDGGPEAR